MTATISTNRNIDKQLKPHEPQQKLTLFKFSCECVKVIHSFLFSASLCSNCVLLPHAEGIRMHAFRMHICIGYIQCIPSSTCLPVHVFQCLPNAIHSQAWNQYATISPGSTSREQMIISHGLLLVRTLYQQLIVDLLSKSIFPLSWSRYKLEVSNSLYQLLMPNFRTDKLCVPTNFSFAELLVWINFSCRQPSTQSLSWPRYLLKRFSSA